MVKKVILLTFQDDKFMTYLFISSLLEILNLKDEGRIKINLFDTIHYSAMEREDILSKINYNSIHLELFTKNDAIELVISNPHIVGFSELELICLENEVDKYLNILFEFFGSSFYTLHIQDLKRYEKQKLARKKLKTGHNESLVSKLFSEYIYRYVGINVGVSQCMFFGKLFYSFIEKSKVLNYPQARLVNGNDEIILIKLYDNESKKIRKKNIKKFKDYFQIDELVKNIIQNKYMSPYYHNYCIKGYDNYDKKLLLTEYIAELEKKKASNEVYHISILDFDLILKKYRNTCFINTEANLCAAEILAYFVYSEDDMMPESGVYQSKASITVQLSNVQGSVIEYANANNYTLTKINDTHYLFEKRENCVLTIMNYYILKEDCIYYDITLEIREDKLNKSQINKIINEYNRIIKSAKLKENK